MGSNPTPPTNLNMEHKIEFDHVERALLSLTEALARPPANDLERDGAIQRFEFTFEALWKIGQRVLAREGVSSTSPKSVIRDLAAQGMLPDALRWMDFLEARSLTSHTYLERNAQKVFAQLPDFLTSAQALLKRLKVRAA